MLNVYDLSMKRKAVLENAFDKLETTELNTVGGLSFSMPENDPKCEFCKKRHYVRFGTDVQLYRILDKKRKKGETGVITYECEHVIAKLIDKAMFGTYAFGGTGKYTRDALNYLMSLQKTRDWVLDRCAFSRQFEYSWSHAGLLDAVFSIPNRFVDPYIWRYDTQGYPWKLSLDAIDINEKPQFYIRANKNLLTLEEDDPSAGIVTVLYCLGYGEGDNQLTIKDVNGGLPYLKSPQEYIDEYGEVELIWADKRFENAANLKARGEALLAEYQEPRMSRTLSVAELSQLTNDDLDKAEVGKIVMLSDDNFKTYITKVIRNLDTGEVSQITIQNKPSDIANAVADLAERQRITEVYSQGATQLYAQSIQANATQSIGAILRFNIPSEMRIVNAVKAKITLNQFRSYSRATDSAGETTQTSSEGGGGSQTSSAGGGASTTSAGNDNTDSLGNIIYYQTEAASLWTEYREMSVPALSTGNSGVSTGQALTGNTNSHNHYYLAPSGSHYHLTPEVNLTHYHLINSHRHSFYLPRHSHGVSIGSHSHSVSIPSHSHSVSIPAHSHDIEQGIFEFGHASGANIYINGVMKGTMSTDAELDITSYLLDERNAIPRDSWIEVEVRPNDLAYVTIDMFVKGFVQSTGGGNY